MTSVTAGVTDRSPGTRLGEGVAHDVRDVIRLNPKNSIVAPPSVQPRCVVQEITCYLQLSAEIVHNVASILPDSTRSISAGVVYELMSDVGAKTFIRSQVYLRHIYDCVLHEV